MNILPFYFSKINLNSKKKKKKIQIPRKKDATWRGAAVMADWRPQRVHCFSRSEARDAAVLLSLQCTPTSLSHSPREHAAAALVAGSHSICTYPELSV